MNRPIEPAEELHVPYALRGCATARPAGSSFVVLSNRAPYRHERLADGGIATVRSASGLVTALEPLVAACLGTWVAHAAGSADVLCSDIRPPGVAGVNSPYRLRYVSLPGHVHRGFYDGFANEGLWPLCHDVHVRPLFRADDFRMYQIANARFAAAAREAAGAGPAVVLVQDYHFALAPRLLRGSASGATVVAFWHIPWPAADVFRTCPWSRELLDGLLGSDIVGLQTLEDCANFLACVEEAGLGSVDRRRSLVEYRQRSTRVRAYPVGIEWTNAAVRGTPAPPECRRLVRREFGLPSGVCLGIGVDRLDYTKGLTQKLVAIERLLEGYPQWRDRFAFVQVAEPSRDHLPSYRAARADIVAARDRINSRFGSGCFPPITLVERHHDPEEVYRLYKAADLCYVGSLRDGMNLVAKEYVSARTDERGVLVLSHRAGASRQLAAALLVNPSSVDECAAALRCALTMPAAEQSQRLRQMRAVVEKYDTFWWVRQILRDAQSAQQDRTRQGPPTGAAWSSAG